VGVVKALLRFVSYVFHGLLALGLLALSGLAFIAGAQSLHLDMLPWTGSTLLYVLLLGSAAGLVILILALRGLVPWLFFLWSLVIAGLIVKSYFLSSYRFHPGEAKTAMYLAVGALIALVGAWFVMTRRRPAR
jgi:hypothetical protein